MTEIVVTPGASGALMSSAMGMIQEGDEVVIFEPYFDIYVP